MCCYAIDASRAGSAGNDRECGNLSRCQSGATQTKQPVVEKPWRFTWFRFVESSPARTLGQCRTVKLASGNGCSS
jgi:hypothetical protein